MSYVLTTLLYFIVRWPSGDGGAKNSICPFQDIVRNSSLSGPFLVTSQLPKPFSGWKSAIPVDLDSTYFTRPRVILDNVYFHTSLVFKMDMSPPGVLTWSLVLVK